MVEFHAVEIVEYSLLSYNTRQCQVRKWPCLVSYIRSFMLLLLSIFVCTCLICLKIYTD